MGRAYLLHSSVLSVLLLIISLLMSEAYEVPRNPTGKNQYSECRECAIPIFATFCIDLGLAPQEDPYVRELICKYDREGVKSPKTISELLLADHGIKMR